MENIIKPIAPIPSSSCASSNPSLRRKPNHSSAGWPPLARSASAKSRIRKSRHCAQDLYRKKGYPDDWIALRARGVATRAELTNEWKNRGIEKSSDYAILTAEISKAAFGMTPAEYKRLKGLKSENLRDHMSTLELLFTELSEAATTEIARNDDAQGMAENADAARRGGKIAGDARENLERQTGRSVSTSDNYKHLSSRTRKKLPEEES